MKKIERKTHLFDANRKILGRMATEIALILRGKNKVDFTYNIDGGDEVVVINTDKVRVSGSKEEGKLYHRYSGYPGGITEMTLAELRAKDSRKIIYKAVYGMLPKNNLRPAMLKRLFLFKDAEHEKKIDIEHK